MDGRFSTERDEVGGMSERTERSEGHEGMPKAGIGMSERTERSEGHEGMPKAGAA